MRVADAVILAGLFLAIGIACAGQALAKHIIFIIDESIRGGMLSINGHDVDTTPFLASVSKKARNYGVASSCTNCSSTTNIILVTGIGLHQLPDTGYETLKESSLFQYAKRAEV